MSDKKKASAAGRALGRLGAGKQKRTLKDYWASLTPADRLAIARRGYERGIVAGRKKKEGSDVRGPETTS